VTTIVWRDGILAADSKAYGGNYKQSPGSKTKLRTVTGSGRFAGAIGGVSTNVVGGDVMLWDWVERGAPFPEANDLKPESFSILLITPDGAVWLANDALSFSGPIDCRYYAVGSGDHFALGALAMGASAVEAVDVAAIFDCHTGGEIMALTL